MPFEIACAQDEFQRAIDITFGDIPNVLGIADDIVVVGFDDNGGDHDKALLSVLERAREKGARFNEEKLIVRAREIPFFGHLIGKDGVRPDPSKIQAIQQMSPPNNVKDLMSFLGLVTYLNRFSPNIATLTSSLRALLKQGTEFQWSPSHQNAFDNVKREILKSTTLQYYIPNKELVLQVDASSAGLGAALIQDSIPIAYASKSLAGAELRYSNIEREMLAIVFGLQRFHHYVYGREVTVHTDHKPLESISVKRLANAPPPLARMLLKVQGYNFNVTYKPGRDVPVADALSRVSPCNGEEIPGVNIQIHAFDTLLHASPTRLNHMRGDGC